MTHPIENIVEKAASDIIAERDRLQSELTAANRFKQAFVDLFADQIDAAVKSAMDNDFDISAYESEIQEMARDGFDIDAYESEIQEMARDGFDARHHSEDITDALGFDMSDHTSEIADLVRDILRDSTIKLDV